MKVLISGSSGIGKSTVIAELAKRGYTAIDGDEEPGLARLELKSTGEPVDWPKGFVDWSVYAWNLNGSVLEGLLNRNRIVFLGGVYGNQPDFYNLFDKLLVLTISRDEHQRRLNSRPPREANDDPQNIKDKLNKQPVIRQRLLDAGFELVDASGDINSVVDNILRRTVHETK